MLVIVNIPAYNEEKKIGSVIKAIPKNLGKNVKVKVQVADDGSDDSTVKVSKEAGAEFVYRFPHRGLGPTFKQGVEKALANQADIMVNIDADGQFPPGDIPRIAGPVIKGEADMVVGSRFSKHKDRKPKNMPLAKRVLNYVAAKIVGLFWGKKIDDLTCGFRAYNREVLLRLNLNHSFTYTQETIIDALAKGMRIKWLPVRVIYFTERKSRMTGKLWRFIYQSTMIIVKMLRDTKPLKFFGAPALFFITTSLIIFIRFFVYYVQYFKVSPFRTWLALASILLILGIQLLVFALIADMIRSQRQISEENSYLARKRRFDKLR